MRRFIRRWLRGPVLQPTSKGMPMEDIDITITSTESIYAEPMLITTEAFQDMVEHTVSFGHGAPLVGITQQGFQKAVEHAMSDTSVEIGGLCVGQVYRQDTRLLISIQATLQADYTLASIIAHSKTHVTFTAEVWEQLLTTYLRDFADMRVVGWYHSHPGFGVFLSGLDLFIHENFFAHPWQVAVVVEPVQRQFGIFARHETTLLPPALLTWEDNLQVVKQEVS